MVLTNNDLQGSILSICVTYARSQCSIHRHHTPKVAIKKHARNKTLTIFQHL
jgi:hypothetical protein